eukprot:2448462-Rhodomonas_salina.2
MAGRSMAQQRIKTVTLVVVVQHDHDAERVGAVWRALEAELLVEGPVSVGSALDNCGLLHVCADPKLQRHRDARSGA